MKTKNIAKLIFIISFLSVINSNAQLSFTKSDTPLGTEPGKCATSGDIDNDGDIDIIIGFYNRDYIDSNRLWINDGYGNFILSGTFVGDNSIYVKLADLNKDNYPDIILVGSAWGVGDKNNKILLNNKNGTFTDYEQEIDSGAQFVQIIDFNDDGFSDFNLGKSVWLNDGTGYFTNSGISVGGDEIRNFTLGDLDQDGDLDALTAIDVIYDGIHPTVTKPCKVFFNDGSNEFVLDNTQNISNSNTQKVLLGDFNGDDFPDAFILNTHTDVSQNDELWLNDGSGIFNKQDFNDVHRITLDGALIDFDNDGDLDVYCNYNVFGKDEVPQAIWINDGNGSFTLGDSSIIAMTGFDINDYNGDGKKDVLAITTTGNYIWFNTTITDISSVKIQNIKIYPIPAQNTLQIDYPGLIHNNVSYKIMDLSGKTIQEGKLTGDTINVSKIGKGTYILNLNIGKESMNKKITIN